MKLEGWKQISYYLRVSNKTAQKWALRRRMPVHHLSNGQVFAQSAELDAWKLTVPAPAPVAVRRAPAAIRRAVTVRLPPDVLDPLLPLIRRQFSTMQQFLACAITHYAEQQLRAPVLSP